MNSLWRRIAVAGSAIRESGMNGWINWNRRWAMPACLALWAVAGFAQVPPPVILEIDIENYVQYFDDVGDPSKFATDVNERTTTRVFAAFTATLHLADIVAVNGRPAKGTYINRSQLVRFNPTMTPGQSIADISRSGGPGLQAFEILQPDGTPIGTIMTQWLVSGSPPPGSPAAITTGNGAIVGGTGAFLNVRGQSGFVGGAGSRNTSYAEDPANRRLYGGGRLRMLLYLIPMSRPEIQATPTGPAVVHSSDFTLVTAAKPAKAGEILSLFATGLGPVRANVDPGRPFPTSPLALVNSPVEVMVNGKSAEVLAAVGYPGSVDGYQVNFRIPAGMSPGMATLQVITAWIPSSAVSIAIQ
jgi:hypothetical protein